MKITATDPLAVYCKIIDLSTGEDMTNVFDADDEAGTVSRYAVDGRGNLFPDPDVPNRAAVQHLSGLRIRIDIEGAPGQIARMPLAAYLAQGKRRAKPKAAEDDDGPTFPDTDAAEQ